MFSLINNPQGQVPVLTGVAWGSNAGCLHWVWRLRHTIWIPDASSPHIPSCNKYTTNTAYHPSCTLFSFNTALGWDSHALNCLHCCVGLPAHQPQVSLGRKKGWCGSSFLSSGRVIGWEEQGGESSHLKNEMKHRHGVVGVWWIMMERQELSQLETEHIGEHAWHYTAVLA